MHDDDRTVFVVAVIRFWNDGDGDGYDNDDDDDDE